MSGPLLLDRVSETTTTTGTGDLALAGAIAGFRTFASVLSGADTCYYAVEAISASGVPSGDWEVGLGTYNSVPNTLTRTTVLASSNSGSAVNFAAGLKRVFLTAPASYLSNLGISQLTGDVTAGPGSGSQVATLPTVNGNVGSFAIATVTVNAKGQVTAASAASTTGSGNVVLATSPTITTPTIASFANATHNHQNAAGGGTLDTAAIASGTLAAARMPALTGDVTTTAGAVATTLATVNSNVGTFALSTVTVNAKGLVTAASAASTTGSGNVVLATSPTITTPSIAKLANLTTNGFVITSGDDGTLSIDTSTYLTANQTITLSGDITGSGATTITTTLATVNGNVGSFALATVTVNGKGLVTAASAASTTGSGDVVLATSPTITTPTIASITGPTTVTISNAATTTVTTILTIDTTSSGTPAGGYGLALFFTGKDSTTTAQNMAQMRTTWTTATHGSAVSNLLFSVYTNTTAVDAVTVTTAGSTFLASDAVTNTATSALTLDHSTSGTPAASYGTGMAVNGSSATVASRNMGRLYWFWQTATDASRKSQWALTAYSTTTETILLSGGANASGRYSVRVGSGAQAQDAALEVATQASQADGLRISGNATQGTFFRVVANSTVSLVTISSTGVTTIVPADAGTNTVLNSLVIDHSTSGTPTTNYGTGISVLGQDSTTVSQNMAIFEVYWTTATHASRKARLDISAYDTAKRVAISVEASGTAALLSFYNAATVAQATTAGAASTFAANTSGTINDSATWDSYTIGQVVKALRNLGLLA